MGQAKLYLVHLDESLGANYSANTSSDRGKAAGFGASIESVNHRYDEDSKPGSHKRGDDRQLGDSDEQSDDERGYSDDGVDVPPDWWQASCKGSGRYKGVHKKGNNKYGTLAAVDDILVIITYQV